MATSLGSIFTTLTGSAGIAAVLAETSFLQPASVPTTRDNSAAIRKSFGAFRTLHHIRCLYTIMLALHYGEVVTDSVGACDTANALNPGTCHFDETETEWIQKSDDSKGIQSRKSLIRMQRKCIETALELEEEKPSDSEICELATGGCRPAVDFGPSRFVIIEVLCQSNNSRPKSISCYTLSSIRCTPTRRYFSASSSPTPPMRWTNCAT